MLQEINFDGIIGPSHNYAGLSLGNLASTRNAGHVSQPRAAALFIRGRRLFGRNPGVAHRNVYIATGDSGNGMTHGTIAGMLLTDLILGRRNDWEAIYDPARFTLKALPEFAKENLNVAAQYKDLIFGADVDSETEIKRGSGAVISRGLHKVAVYRDPSGETHERSAVCPHLGCIVQWNGATKSWDCPCHGSRFDVDGHIIEGPAVKPLEPVDLDAEVVQSPELGRTSS